MFATVRPEDGGGPGAAFSAVGAKPHYVDFDSPLSLHRASKGWLVGSARSAPSFEEMRPGKDALHVRSPQGRHVAELALEKTSPRPAAAPAGQDRRHGRQDTPA